MYEQEFTSFLPLRPCGAHAGQTHNSQPAIMIIVCEFLHPKLTTLKFCGGSWDLALTLAPFTYRTLFSIISRCSFADFSPEIEDALGLLRPTIVMVGDDDFALVLGAGLGDRGFVLSLLFLFLLSWTTMTGTF